MAQASAPVAAPVTRISEPAPRPGGPWPRPAAFMILLAIVGVQAYLWFKALQHMWNINQRHETHEWEHEFFGMMEYITYALVALMLTGWAWRWAVARGWIGGRPTARFGGA